MSSCGVCVCVILEENLNGCLVGMLALGYTILFVTVLIVNFKNIFLFKNIFFIFKNLFLKPKY